MFLIMLTWGSFRSGPGEEAAPSVLELLLLVLLLAYSFPFTGTTTTVLCRSAGFIIPRPEIPLLSCFLLYLLPSPILSVSSRQLMRRG